MGVPCAQCYLTAKTLLAEEDILEEAENNDIENPPFTSVETFKEEHTFHELVWYVCSDAYNEERRGREERKKERV